MVAPLPLKVHFKHIEKQAPLDKVKCSKLFLTLFIGENRTQLLTLMYLLISLKSVLPDYYEDSEC